MYDFVYKNKRVIQVIIALIALPFAFFGIDSYFRSIDADQPVATVGGYKISLREFESELRDRQDYMRQILGGNLDPSALDSAEMRRSVLEGMIRQRLLVAAAMRGGMLVSDEQLRRVIAEIPAFQENGRFSNARYEQALRARGQNPAVFEAMLRRDLAVDALNDAFVPASLVAETTVRRLLALGEQSRELSVIEIAPEAHAARVKLDADAAKKYYDTHQAEFALPEQVRVEYVTLSAAALAQQIGVTPAEVRQYYEQSRAQLQGREERRASHILVTVDAGGGEQARAQARAKAEELVRQAKKNPAGFAELARKHSQDPGSAAQGGDLGFFATGAMVKEFDAAVFAMKPGEIAGPVETQYGFHVIRLAEVRGKGFEELKGQIEADLRKQQAARRFAELADQFSNLAFEQSDSLKPIAEALKLPIRTSGWLTRSGAADKPFGHPRLLAAVFSEDVIKGGRNTEAIDIGEQTLVAARLAEHRPASVRPFDAVKDEIAKRLVREQARQLAAEDGRERLARLMQGGDAGMAWGPARLVRRADAKGYSPAVLQQAFKADAGRLPAYVGVDNGDRGYALVRITKVVEAGEPPPEQVRALAQQLAQLIGQEQQSAFVSSLTQKADVEIRQDRIERKQP